MAADMPSDNKAALESSLGRAATGTDLYMAHFLGLGGARSFLNDDAGNPAACRARRCSPPPRAPTASIFYDAGGNAAQPRRHLPALRRQARQGAASVGATACVGRSAASGLIPAIARGGDFERQGQFRALAAMTDIGGATVMPGRATIAAAPRPGPRPRSPASTRPHRRAPTPRPTTTCSARRPTTARLAYMMLASMGANRRCR